MNKEIIIYNTMVAKSILSLQNALSHMDVLKRTPYWNADVKKYGNALILLLIKNEKGNFNKMEIASTELEGMKDSIDNAFRATQKATDLMAKTVMYGYDDFELVFQAMLKDRNSILGIAKKIMK
jgi:methionine-rich copper-binding protein CopC